MVCGYNNINLLTSYFLMLNDVVGIVCQWPKTANIIERIHPHCSSLIFLSYHINGTTEKRRNVPLGQKANRAIQSKLFDFPATVAGKEVILKMSRKHTLK